MTRPRGEGRALSGARCDGSPPGRAAQTQMRHTSTTANRIMRSLVFFEAGRSRLAPNRIAITTTKWKVKLACGVGRDEGRRNASGRKRCTYWTRTSLTRLWKQRNSGRAKSPLCCDSESLVFWGVDGYFLLLTSSTLLHEVQISDGEHIREEINRIRNRTARAVENKRRCASAQHHAYGSAWRCAVAP